MPAKAPQDTESRHADKYIVRFPAGMRDRLKSAAQSNNRTLNAELVARVEASFSDTLNEFAEWDRYKREMLQRMSYETVKLQTAMFGGAYIQLHEWIQQGVLEQHADEIREVIEQAERAINAVTASELPRVKAEFEAAFNAAEAKHEKLMGTLRAFVKTDPNRSKTKAKKT